VFHSGSGSIVVFTKPFFVVFIIGVAVIWAVFIPWIVLFNEGYSTLNISLIVDSSFGAGVSAACFALLFALCGCVVILRLAFTMKDSVESGVKQVGFFLFFKPSKLCLTQLCLASDHGNCFFCRSYCGSQFAVCI
jgi:hypothetical protein